MEVPQIETPIGKTGQFDLIWDARYTQICD
jgi:hypothetical protein